MQAMSNFVQGAVREVFSTMISLEVEGSLHGDSDQGRHPTEYTGVTGSVSFTGKMTGTLYLSMSEKFASDVGAEIMGNSSIPDEDINDVVGELTNMVTGNLKSKMSDEGYGCTLSIPTVIRGNNVSIDSPVQGVMVSGEFNILRKDEKVSVCVFAKFEN